MRKTFNVSMYRMIILSLLIGEFQNVAGQGYWQQRVDYRMEIDFDIKSHRFDGVQDLVYYNNSPDTITQAFYHLYFNAFQPGSSMDIWTRHVPDPDRRLLRIPFLPDDEQGFLQVKSLKQDTTLLEIEVSGTILEVKLFKPLYPGDSVLLAMQFSGQVPVQIRRSGRDNAEGIAYSMSQWYPKLCAYDSDGWHPNQYIGHEFYGDFGDFEISISIDRNYTVAASGQLQNANSIGHGYEDAGTQVPETSAEKITWRFIAENVHDFAWAADPDYTHKKFIRDDGIVLHYFYQETPENSTQWAQLPQIMDHALDFINMHYGEYPYPVFSFIQAGDGGMEYPMATLITGNQRSLRSLVSVSVHELLHSWYYAVLATNESLHAWMDEGFTNYTQFTVMHELERQGFISPVFNPENIFEGNYQSYLQVAVSGFEEPMSLHADHFTTNTGYGNAAYAKGCVFLAQLGYIIGSQTLLKVLNRYFETWKFKHPRPLDFIRIAEKESGLVLDWYYEYWILTTRYIDYNVLSVQPNRNETIVILQRSGTIPMPLELKVTARDGTEFWYYLPLDLMRGNRNEGIDHMQVMRDWDWVNPEYTLTIPVKLSQLASVVIDPGMRLADVRRANNTFSTLQDND